jgi:hypothetical protein
MYIYIIFNDIISFIYIHGLLLSNPQDVADLHSFNLAFGIKLTASCGRQEITCTAKNMTQRKKQ